METSDFFLVEFVEGKIVNIDMTIYVIGAFGIAGITTILFLWAMLTGNYKEDEHMKRKPLEEDEQ